MKITIANLVNAIPIFNRVMDKELTPVTSFKLVKLIKAINSEIEIFEKERAKLLNKYGIKNDDENSYAIPDENKENWNKDITDLLSLEVEISADKINLMGEDIKIAPIDMMKIEEFVEIN